MTLIGREYDPLEETIMVAMQASTAGEIAFRADEPPLDVDARSS